MLTHFASKTSRPVRCILYGENWEWITITLNPRVEYLKYIEAKWSEVILHFWLHPDGTRQRQNIHEANCTRKKNGILVWETFCNPPVKIRLVSRYFFEMLPKTGEFL
jgi:hypothetical protein